MSKPRIALALGSGGLRGIAHICVLRALAEAKIQPTVYAGSSAGAGTDSHSRSLASDASIVFPR
jgi:NTE family protein